MILIIITLFFKFYFENPKNWIRGKVNFFERTNSEYALANKTIEDDVFEFKADF